MPSITLKCGTFTNSSGESTFHMALIVSSPEVHFIVQSDESGKLSSNNTTEIGREYSCSTSFEITPHNFVNVPEFIPILLEEISINPARYKCGTYILFFLHLAGLFPEQESDFPAEIPAKVAEYLYFGIPWPVVNIVSLTTFAEIIDKEFTPELMLKLVGLLQQRVTPTPISTPLTSDLTPKLDSKTEIDAHLENRVKFFKRIYQALHYGESSFFRKDFLKGKEKLSASQLQNEIASEVLNYPDGQVNTAWRLAERYAYLNDSTMAIEHTAYAPQLFFSICMDKSHTFVTVSVQDKIFKKNFILFAAEMGPLWTRKPSLYKVISDSLPGGIRNKTCEKLRKVTYQSFEITLDQYNELLNHVAEQINIEYLCPQYLLDLPELEATSEKSEEAETSESYRQRLIYANIPSAFSAVASGAEIDNGLHKMNFRQHRLAETSVITREAIAAQLNPNSPYNQYNLMRNNCRHVGIELSNVIFKQQQRKKLFSSNGLTDFPYTGLIYNGEFIDHHYILPAPPSKGELDPKLYKILARLYKRLEEIPKLKPDAQLTMDKFNALKDLYHSLAPEQPLRFEQLLTVINTWEKTGKNKDIVDTHRGVKFFQNTSTRNSITELKTLAEIKPPSGSWFGCS